MQSELTHARHDPALATMGIFRSLKRGPRSAKLDISYQLGDVTVRIIGFEELGADDEDCLLSTLALAGPDGESLSATPTGPSAQALITSLAPRGEAAKQDRLVIATTFYRLAQITGVDPGSGSAYGRLRASLTRLANVQCLVSSPEAHGQENLLAWVLQESGAVKIAVNAKLAQAILGAPQYITISIEERRALQSDPAKILHARLSAMIRPGTHWKYSLNTLADLTWGQPGSASTTRWRRKRIRQVLHEFADLPGWTVRNSNSRVEIHRPQEKALPAKRSRFTGVTLTPLSCK